MIEYLCKIDTSNDCLYLLIYDWIWLHIMIDCDYIASPNCCDGTPEKNLTLWHCQNILSHIYSPSQSSHEPHRYLVSLLAWLCLATCSSRVSNIFDEDLLLAILSEKQLTCLIGTPGPSRPTSPKPMADHLRKRCASNYSFKSDRKPKLILKIAGSEMSINDDPSLFFCRATATSSQVLKKFGQWQFNDGLLSPKVHSRQGCFARACWDKLIGFKDHQWQSGFTLKCKGLLLKMYLDIYIYIHIS